MSWCGACFFFLAAVGALCVLTVAVTLVWFGVVLPIGRRLRRGDDPSDRAGA